MSNVGWVGLGKLGAPCAATLAKYGAHAVYGFDVRGPDAEYPWSNLPAVNVVKSIEDVVAATDDVVYVAVQTPHSPAYGGTEPTPKEPREFEYRFLVSAVRAVCREALAQQKPITLVVVSTVLPGTFDRLLRPLVNNFVTPVYHPFFIAMGTVVKDFFRPEMTLFGADNPTDVDVVRALYEPIHDAPAPTMSIASAELTKVAYNTFISMKIVFANTMATMCEATGADVDDVIDALSVATDRIISPRYMRAGMGDGGACHPRDNVALSALAQRHNLPVDLMGFLNTARDAQSQWLVDIAHHWSELTSLPICVLGKSYKPNVTLLDGSPALLLVNQLASEYGVLVEHVENIEDVNANDAGDIGAQVFVIATRHDVYQTYMFPAGSVVIDPFGYIPQAQDDVVYVYPGRKK